ncbi:MAG: DUF4198 domain-containing protein [Alphaproteobacteria bacterium]|nr:DUF4198 domain-containing protein [Alphaproteobacteria bacterium]
MKKKIFFIFAIVIVITSFAHEYMILASKFDVRKGDSVECHLFVADGFNIEFERRFQKQQTTNFELITNQKRKNLLIELKDSTFPIFKTEVDFEGLGLLHMERNYAKISLEKKKFIDYLKEDHIENISSNSIVKNVQNERYTRYLKSLINSHNVNNDTIYKTIVGQKFEIILLQNPYKLKIGQILKAQILFNGLPLQHKMVTFRNRWGGEAATKQVSRTNQQGICSFLINRKGDCFIHVTHMIPCPEPQEADWESFWASYSFGIH